VSVTCYSMHEQCNYNTINLTELWIVKKKNIENIYKLLKYEIIRIRLIIYSSIMVIANLFVLFVVQIHSSLFDNDIDMHVLKYCVISTLNAYNSISLYRLSRLLWIHIFSYYLQLQSCDIYLSLTVISHSHSSMNYLDNVVF
jgi:hypothetical protein